MSISKAEAENARTNRFLRKLGGIALVVLLLYVPCSLVLQVGANRKADRGRARIGGLVQDVHDCTTPDDPGNACQQRTAPAQRQAIHDVAVATARCVAAPDIDACVTAALERPTLTTTTTSGPATTRPAVTPRPTITTLPPARTEPCDPTEDQCP